MKAKYWLCKRNEIFFSFDSTTGKRESLHTADREAAKQIISAKNDAATQPAIWKTAWAGSFMVTFMLFCLATLGIFYFFDNYAERKAAEKIAYVERLMNYNQEAFRQLAIAQVPVHVTRTQSYGVANPQNFALGVEGADSAEMRNENESKNGVVFFTSHLPEAQIQLLQQAIDKLTQITNSSAK
jgi:hypothetical protein